MDRKYSIVVTKWIKKYSIQKLYIWCEFITIHTCLSAPKLCSIIWNWKWPSYNWGDDKTNRSAGSARKVHLKPLHREVPTIMCCSMSRFPISATNVATNPRSHLCTPLEKHSMSGTNKSMWSSKFKLAFSSMRWKINECSILSRR